MTEYYSAALAAVLLTALSQILIKLGARRAAQASWRMYFTWYTVAAYSMLFMATLLNTYALRKIPLKMGLVLLPLTLLLVMGLSCGCLHERLTRKQLIGATIIILGFVVYGLELG